MSAPVALMGWPSEMPEPLGLTWRVQAQVFGHGAGLGGEGLVGFDHIQIVDGEARLFNASCVAGTGPMPMYLGSTPAWA